MNTGLIIFAREPIPGSVKTRLAASIGDHAAAELYENMLQAALQASRQLPGIKTVVYWACEEDALPRLAEKYQRVSRRQSLGNLGQRMQNAFTEMFASGYSPCCIIGSDAPDLPVSYIAKAYQLLTAQQADVVIGPSRDGGYYLLGMRQLWPQLFTDIPWSSAEVCELSLVAARSAGLTSALLPHWQDIDTVADLQAYQERNQG